MDGARPRRGSCRQRCEAGAEPGSARRKRPPARGVRVWVDITAPAHVLVFRPLLEILRERGDTVAVTARDYAQTVQLLELHGIEADVLGRHGGRSRLGKFRSLTSRLREHVRAEIPDFELLTPAE